VTGREHRHGCGYAEQASKKSPAIRCSISRFHEIASDARAMAV
jgi:hypothetical protein